MDSNSSVIKINKSRYNLKKYLEKEWNVSSVLDFSDIEIDKLYRSNKPSNSGITFGNASCCNFSVYHKDIPSHRLHIIYYNFPEIGKSSIKVTKTCSDKISNLYKDNLINKEDSIIIILHDQVPVNLEKAIEDLYLNGQEEIVTTGLSPEINEQNDALENKYTNLHFRNIHIYHLDELAIDITSHVKVPEHEVIRKQNEINEILDKCNCRINQLPIIMRSDAMGKRLRLAPGDICKITRITQTAGETIYYRVCK